MSNWRKKLLTFSLVSSLVGGGLYLQQPRKADAFLQETFRQGQQAIRVCSVQVAHDAQYCNGLSLFFSSLPSWSNYFTEGGTLDEAEALLAVVNSEGKHLFETGDDLYALRNATEMSIKELEQLVLVKRDGRSAFTYLDELITFCQAGGTYANHVSVLNTLEREAAPSIRIVYLVPKDRKPHLDVPKALERAAKKMQEFYYDQLGTGETLKLHDPLVEVHQTSRTAKWYSTHKTSGEIFWDNVLADGFHKTGAKHNDERHMWLFYIDADPGEGQSTGATSQIAVFPANDIRGIAQIEKQVTLEGETHPNAPFGRWIGGMIHEVGHNLGMPHPDNAEYHTRDEKKDGSGVMGWGYQNFPNTHLTKKEKEFIRDNRFFVPINPYYSNL